VPLATAFNTSGAVIRNGTSQIVVLTSGETLNFRVRVRHAWRGGPGGALSPRILIANTVPALPPTYSLASCSRLLYFAPGATRQEQT
jgi:hypothetical protein